jgi:hypothetical protein
VRRGSYLYHCIEGATKSFKAFASGQTIGTHFKRVWGQGRASDNAYEGFKNCRDFRGRVEGGGGGNSIWPHYELLCKRNGARHQDGSKAKGHGLRLV